MRLLCTQLILAAVISMFADPSLSAAQAHDSKGGTCPNAAILAIHGKWTATSVLGSRLLQQWDCLAADEEIKSADPSNGQITIIYNDGAIEPVTLTCQKNSLSHCHNAYRVLTAKSAQRKPEGNSEILDFFFSLFKKNEPKPVPTILQGKLDDASGVVCSEGRYVNLQSTLKQPDERHVLTLEPNQGFISYLNTTNPQAAPIRQGKVTVSKNLYATLTEAPTQPVLFWVEPKKNAGFLRDLGGFLVHDHLQDESTLLLVADKPSCRSLIDSYQTAVEFTRTWPKDTPRDAIVSFHSLVLGGLAIQPEYAPVKELPLVQPPKPE